MYFVLLYCIILLCLFIFFFKQKTAYEMRISDWSSDVCSSDLDPAPRAAIYSPKATSMALGKLGRIPAGPSTIMIATMKLRAQNSPAQRISITVRKRTPQASGTHTDNGAKIGRAACRERVVSTCRSRGLLIH